MESINYQTPLDESPLGAETSQAQPDEKAIFIVGVSRSGTTLMRNILNNSSQIAISRENHFLGHLIGSEGMRYKFRQFGDLAQDANVHRLVQYLYSGEMEKSGRFRKASAHWRWITRRIEPQVLEAKILASDRSDRALFVTMMQVFAERKGKSIMGEKTPAHYRYAATLLQYFPNGRIIHMLRDPRGIYISELRRRKKENDAMPFRQLRHFPALMKIYILLQTTWAWAESIRKGVHNRIMYPQHYLIQRFEDLVRQPESEIRKICAFLEVEFEENLLEQSVVSRGFQEQQAGFDAGAADRWKKHIDPWVDTWFRRLFRKQLVLLGYEPARSSMEMSGTTTQLSKEGRSNAS